MDYLLENDSLTVKIADIGAELMSVVDKSTGTQRLWQGDADVWAGRAPLLFPWCGRLYNGEIWHKGSSHAAPRHGFVRSAVFSLVQEKKGEQLTLETRLSEENRAIYPYDFILQVSYHLAGKKLTQSISVRNTGKEPMPFDIGFHPGFMLESGHNVIEFEVQENPRLILTPEGHPSGEESRLVVENRQFALTDDAFAADSLCMAGLKSRYLTLKNEESGRGVRVNVAGFPYCLLWGPAKGPLPFVCIEPWHGLPDPARRYGNFTDKPGISHLSSGETYHTALEMEFI